MDPFIEYLKTIKNSVGSADFSNTQVHLVMGNESCDLDSMISTLALAFLRQQESPSQMVIPMMNIPEDEFPLKTENNYLLNQSGINPNLLIFKNNLNLQEMQNRTVSLVDHHTLRTEEQYLATSVVEIFDHRPIDPSAVWDTNKVTIRIEQVGSCSTLIAALILHTNINIVNPLLANLLYHVIIFDTVAFSVEAERAKELDITIAKRLTEKFNLKEDYKAIFKELWAAHNDVSNLSPKQLLSKDLKIVEGLPVAGLPMLVEDFLKLPDVSQDMVAFCIQKCCTNLVIVGLNVVDQEVLRDIAVFNYCNKYAGLRDAIIINLKNALVLKGYDFCLEEVRVNVANVNCFRQNNVTLTRKHILPIIKHTIVQYRETNK